MYISRHTTHNEKLRKAYTFPVEYIIRNFHQAQQKIKYVIHGTHNAKRVYVLCNTLHMCNSNVTGSTFSLSLFCFFWDNVIPYTVYNQERCYIAIYCLRKSLLYVNKVHMYTTSNTEAKSRIK